MLGLTKKTSAVFSSHDWRVAAIHTVLTFEFSQEFVAVLRPWNESFLFFTPKLYSLPEYIVKAFSHCAFMCETF